MQPYLLVSSVNSQNQSELLDAELKKLLAKYSIECTELEEPTDRIDRRFTFNLPLQDILKDEIELKTVPRLIKIESETKNQKLTFAKLNNGKIISLNEVKIGGGSNPFTLSFDSAPNFLKLQRLPVILDSKAFFYTQKPTKEAKTIFTISAVDLNKLKTCKTSDQVLQMFKEEVFTTYETSIFPAFDTVDQSLWTLNSKGIFRNGVLVYETATEDNLQIDPDTFFFENQYASVGYKGNGSQSSCFVLASLQNNERKILIKKDIADSQNVIQQVFFLKSKVGDLVVCYSDYYLHFWLIHKNDISKCQDITFPKKLNDPEMLQWVDFFRAEVSEKKLMVVIGEATRSKNLNWYVC